MSYYFETFGQVEEDGLRVPKPRGFSNSFFNDMTWKKCRTYRNISCSNCSKPISIGSWGFGSSWSKLCVSCGKTFSENMVDYLKRAQLYFHQMENYVEDKERLAKQSKEIEKKNDKKD